MLTHTEILRAYQEYQKQLQNDALWHKDLLNYEKYEVLIGDKIGPRWAPYYMQAYDFTRELLNSINQFRYCIARISSWCEVLKLYSEKEKFDLLIEFINPVALMSLDYPYKIKNKIIYSAYYLSDECKFLTTNPPVTHLAKDKSINYKTLETIASGWSSFEKLKNALALLNGESYKKQTDNFRNAEHHGIPSSIEMGYTRTFQRLPSNEGSRRYGFGGLPPLSLNVLVDRSKDEHQRGVNAFLAFWLLYEEQKKYLIAT